MIKLEMAMSDTNKPTFSIPQSDYINAKYLVANLQEVETVPSQAKHVIISAIDSNGVDVGVYVIMDGIASIPSGDIEDGTAPEIKPYIRSVANISIIGVIAPVDCVVTFAYYA